MSWFILGLKNYAKFSGRARRKEFWMFFLFYYIFLMAVTLLVALLSSIFKNTPAETISIIIMVIVFIGLFIPFLSISVRRLHDTNKTGFWLFLYLIPYAGIALLIFYCLDSTPGDNEYGPNPKIIKTTINTGPGFVTGT
jgi:uncharacterized membrane protein YhaH (DUF805 family)